LLGKGDAAKVAQIGLAEAAVSLQKIRAYGDPRLFALNLAASAFASSAQPIVPERLLVMEYAPKLDDRRGSNISWSDILNTDRELHWRLYAFLSISPLDDRSDAAGSF
jgi:hypothetical protein